MKLRNICPACLWKTLPVYLFFIFSALAGLFPPARGRPSRGEREAGTGGNQGQGDGLSPEQAPAEISSGAYAYLRKYGFIGRDNPQASTIRRLEDYHSAIRSFQQFYGLQETGQVDPDTNRLMSYPRCGLPDVVTNGDPGQGRVKRYSHSGEKWETNEVTYRIINYSSDLSQAKTDNAFNRAFKLWSTVTPLTFRQVAADDADINIKFVVFEHGDGFPFDGEGGTLAHAYFPGTGIGGDAHFDDHETFTAYTNDGTNLYMVAAHEIGHSLGLGHTSDLTALMAPFYMGYNPNFRLGYDDLHGIQSLYGVNPNPPVGVTYQPVAPMPTPDPDGDRCGRSFNAIAYIRGEIFLFKGKNFWRMRVQGQPLEGYPIEIGKFWIGLPNKIDAAYERYDGKIVFLKGFEYWVYEGINQEAGYPRSTNEMGLPEVVDGALPWGQTGKTYFFKGDQYWRFDEFENRVDPGYPKLIKENWLGVPINIDAVFRHSDGYSWNTYFIRNRKYWRFDESRSQVDLGYPQTFSVDWLDCKEQGAGEEKPDELRDVMLATFPSLSTTDSGVLRNTSASTHLLSLAALICCIFTCRL